MWRAARLVIDTGIHPFGWSRDQALSYFRDNTALPEPNITIQVDRYISWPGKPSLTSLANSRFARGSEAEAALSADPLKAGRPTLECEPD